MAQAKVNRKQEKKMKENLLMLDDERRHADQYKEQAEKVNKNCSNFDDYVKHSHCTNCVMAQIVTEWMTLLTGQRPNQGSEAPVGRTGRGSVQRKGSETQGPEGARRPGR